MLRIYICICFIYICIHINTFMFPNACDMCIMYYVRTLLMLSEIPEEKKGSSCQLGSV